jgi:hypothetical protein
MNADPDLSSATKSILEDGFPLQTPSPPVPASDRLPLADHLALNAEADIGTMRALNSFSAIQAADGEMAAAKLRYDAARAAKRLAQAELQLNINRRRQAWGTLARTLGQDAYRSASLRGTPAPRPSGFRRKGKGKQCAGESGDDYDEEPKDAGNVEPMLE